MGVDSSTLANVAIAVSAVVALVFGIFQVLAIARDRRERLTIEVVRALQTREFAELGSQIRQHPPPSTGKELAAFPESTRVSYMQFLQAMEMLGLLVYDRTIELDLVERTLGSYVVNTWKMFKPGIEELRRDVPDPYLSEYFQYLAERVEKLMRERPRPPAYSAPN